MEKNDEDKSKTPTGETDIKAAVETANAEDENRKKSDDTGNDDEEIEDDDDDDSNGDDSGDDSGSDDASNNDDDASGDDSGDDDKKDKSKSDEDQADRKFSQFAGDGTDTAYISNLEKGYDNSSKEAIRLNTELGQATNRIDSIMRAVQADPELATKLNAAISGAGGSDGDSNSGADGVDNPFVKNLQSEWQEKSEAEIAAFIDANPEVVTDPQIKNDVEHFMGVFSNDQFNRTGRLMSGGEAMAAAYKHLDLENKLSKQTLADGAKKTAAPTRQQGSKKKGTSQNKNFTPEQIAMAQAMGKDQAWLEKNAN